MRMFAVMSDVAVCVDTVGGIRGAIRSTLPPSSPLRYGRTVLRNVARVNEECRRYHESTGLGIKIACLCCRNGMHSNFRKCGQSPNRIWEENTNKTSRNKTRIGLYEIKKSIGLHD